MEQKGYPEPGYTQTPNILFDTQMQDMSEVELKVVLCAIRQTLGWHRRRDAISLTQFQQMTGLSRKGVLLGIERAIARGVIETAGNGRRGTVIYQLRIASSTGEQNTPVQIDQAKLYTSTGENFIPELVYKIDTQKKGNKGNKKDSAPAAQDAACSTARKRNPLFDEVAVVLFGATLEDTAAMKRIAGRVGKLVSFLKDRPAAAELSQIKRFVRWYHAKYGAVSLPLDEAKFVTHWTAFETVQAAASATRNGTRHSVHYYYQNAWVAPERLAADGTLDGTLRPAWMLSEIAADGDYDGIRLRAGEKVYHEGTLPLAWQGLE